MEITKTFYASTRKAWRDWLRQHCQSEKEIWLIHYRKQVGKPRLAYNDAVEEALCFGWIDSTVKNVDSERFAQRFSPRKAGSGYSQANKERLRRLIARGEVAKDVRAALGGVLTEHFEFPADIRSALRVNRPAWQNFQRYSEAYQHIRVGFVDAARRRPAEFQKRLKHLVRMTEQNRQFGYGIEGYF